MSANHNTLLSLAVLKVHIDEGTSDYLGYIEKFATHILNKFKPDPVTDAELVQLFRREYGLRIPVQGAQLVLKRMAKKKFLIKEDRAFKSTKALPKLDFSEKRKNAEVRISSILNGLIEYTRAAFQIEWDEVIATSAVLRFLNHFAIDCIKAYVYRTAIPDVNSSKSPGSHIIISKYVQKLHDEGGSLFDSFIVLVKGQLYANSIICPDLESIEKNFRAVTFYLDTPILLNALNLQGKEEYEATIELFGLVNKLGGKLAVFAHTIAETDEVIKFAERHIDDPNATNRVIREIRRTGKAQGDLLLLTGHLEDRLSALGLRIAKTPKYVEKFQIDELSLKDALDEEVHYKRGKALEHDINSIRSIYVLREGRVPRRLEDSRAVFVTTNAKLANAAYKSGKNHNSSREVSSTITNYSLANVAWLKSPLDAPDLPTKETLAACYAALEPSEPLWGKFLSELAALQCAGTISPDDHAILRSSRVTSDELMNLTLGNDKDLNEVGIRKILEKAKKDLVSGYQAKLDSSNSELKKHKEQSETVRKKVSRFCDTAAYVVAVSIYATLSAALVMCAFVAAPFTVSVLGTPQSGGVLVNVAVLFVTVFSLLNVITGMSLRDAFKKLKASTKNYLYSKFFG